MIAEFPSGHVFVLNLGQCIMISEIFHWLLVTYTLSLQQLISESHFLPSNMILMSQWGSWVPLHNQNHTSWGFAQNRNVLIDEFPISVFVCNLSGAILVLVRFLKHTNEKLINAVNTLKGEWLKNTLVSTNHTFTTRVGSWVDFNTPSSTWWATGF